MGVYRVAPAGPTCTGDSPLMGLDGPLTAPPGLTTSAVSGRRRQGGSVHQERKSREVAMRCGDMKRHELFHSELVEEPVKTRWMKMMLGPSPSGYHQGAHQIPGA